MFICVSFYVLSKNMGGSQKILHQPVLRFTAVLREIPGRPVLIFQVSGYGRAVRKCIILARIRDLIPHISLIGVRFPLGHSIACVAYIPPSLFVGFFYSKSVNSTRSLVN